MSQGGAGSANCSGTPGASRTQALIVEDDPAIAALVKQLLEGAGWAVLVVSPMSPELLHTAVDRLEPACVLLDGAGRGEYGQSWLDAAWLHERARPVPVLMFSADGAAVGEVREGISARSRAAGFAGIIEKPFDLDAFEVAVAGIVNSVAAGASAPELVRRFLARGQLN